MINTERKDQAFESVIEDVMKIGRRCASLPPLDGRRPDEILGDHENNRACGRSPIFRREQSRKPTTFASPVSAGS